MKKLEGKVAAVTGGARGIGMHIARALALEGASVAICDVALDDARKTAAEVAAETGSKCEGFSANVADAAQCEAFVKDVMEKLGGLHILVNNAGITRDNLAVRLSEADWDAVLDVNLKGSFLMSKAALKHMMRAREGRIVNIASVVGQMGNAGQANYSASKSGLIGLTKSLAREFASRNVLVNAVAPGFVKTRMTDALPAEGREKLLSMIPLGRFAECEDIARAVVFLSGPDSAYITGTVLPVNGGLYI